MSAQLNILDELAARLATITINNGHLFEIPATSIERARLTPFKNGDLPAINYWATRDSLFSKSGRMETRELNIIIEVYSVTRDEPFTDLTIKLGSTVVTALFRATTLPNVADQVSPALGGLIESLVVNSLTPMIGEGQSPWCASVLDVTVKYNILIGDFSAIIKY